MVPGLNMVEEGIGPAALIEEYQEVLRLLDCSGLLPVYGLSPDDGLQRSRLQRGRCWQCHCTQDDA